jgi:hypothetical protein
VEDVSRQRRWRRSRPICLRCVAASNMGRPITDRHTGSEGDLCDSLHATRHYGVGPAPEPARSSFRLWSGPALRSLRKGDARPLSRRARTTPIASRGGHERPGGSDSSWSSVAGARRTRHSGAHIWAKASAGSATPSAAPVPRMRPDQRRALGEGGRRRHRRRALLGHSDAYRRGFVGTQPSTLLPAARSETSGPGVLAPTRHIGCRCSRGPRSDG